MIENLSSKIDSLSDKTPSTANIRAVEPNLTEPGLPFQREDVLRFAPKPGSTHGDRSIPPNRSTATIIQPAAIQPEIPGPHSWQTTRITPECYPTKHWTSKIAEGLVNNYAHI